LAQVPDISQSLLDFPGTGNRQTNKYWKMPGMLLVRLLVAVAIVASMALPMMRQLLQAVFAQKDYTQKVCIQAPPLLAWQVRPNCFL